MIDHTKDVRLEQIVRGRAVGWDVAVQSVPERLVVSPVPVPVHNKNIFERAKELFSSYVSITPEKVWEKAQLAPVKNQGVSYACTAFAITSALEDQLLLWRHDQAKILSPLHAHVCIGGKDLKEPWDLGYALEALHGALIAEHMHSETGWDSVLCSRAIGSLGLRYGSVEGELAARKALMNGPVVAEIDLWQDLHSFYKSGIYSYVDGNYYGRHTVEVVGASKNYWVIKNSYGPGWGEYGYARIAVGECNLFRYPAYQVYPV